MAIQTRIIKRRIKSVKNTHKITKAMELVSASKMRRAMQSVVSTRPYATLAWDTVLSIGSKIDTNLHPFLRESEKIKNVLLLLITSDRGLAGGFNNNIIKKTFEEIKKLDVDVSIKTICIGKRGSDAIRRLNRPVLASFIDITNNTKFEEVLPIGKMIIDEFLKGEVDTVLVAYTDFKSAMTQVPTILKLLPLKKPNNNSELGKVSEDKTKQEPISNQDYLFEPSPKEVLDRLLPRLVETMVYQAVLESAASEHSARMMAMRSASDAAEEMIEDLSFTFNQARQAGITQEIAEISGGKAALENK